MIAQFKRPVITEIGVRAILWILFIWLDYVEPFIRIIRPEEIWMYQYPVIKSYVTSTSLWIIISVIPTALIISHYMHYKNKSELQNAILSLSLNYGLVGFIIQFLKILVGRPRPNFFYRCFPNGEGTDFAQCTGNRRSFMDGRKSFPSGHSAFAFSSMCFVSLYLSAKLKVFVEGGKGNTLRLCVCIIPLLIASSIAISRTCDYHHHWQDVIAGSILGTVIAYICYRQYFPSIYSCYSSTSGIVGIES